MKVKINISKFLVTLLFFLIAMLSSAIGLKMGLNWTILRAVFQIGISVGLISLSMLVLGFIIAIIISSKKKSNPSKLRKKFADSFNFAEAHLKRFVAKIKLKNALFLAYYLFVCLIGCISFVCISLCFFVKPITIIFLPLIFVEVVPLRKAFEYLLKKDNMAFID